MRDALFLGAWWVTLTVYVVWQLRRLGQANCQLARQLDAERRRRRIAEARLAHVERARLVRHRP